MQALPFLILLAVELEEPTKVYFHALLCQACALTELIMSFGIRIIQVIKPMSYYPTGFSMEIVPMPAL